MYFYTHYNLAIASQIPIRGLDSQAVSVPPPSPDIFISLGHPPRSLTQPLLGENVCCRMAENELLFYHQALGVRIYVRDGREIMIDQSLSCDPDRVSVFILGSIMGAVLCMRNRIPLHGAMIRTGQGAVLVIGSTGAGKSTLALGLGQRGYEILGDDVAPLAEVDGQLCVFPSTAGVKLWQDALDMGGLEDHDLPRVREGLEKFYLPRKGRGSNVPVPVAKVCHLTVHNRDQVLVKAPVPALERLGILRRHTFRGAYIRGLNRQEMHFRLITALAQKPMVTVLRPQKPTMTFQAFIDLMEARVFR